MTPAERKYDEDLVRTMREMARWIAKRSGKVAVTLRTGADRLEQLSTQLPVTQPQPQTQTQTDLQPASTPPLTETAREHGRK